MTEPKINILIVGGGRKARALIELLSSIESIHIVGAVDINSDAPAITLAKELGIPTASDYKEFLDNKELGGIINATDSQQLQEELSQNAPSNIKVINGSCINPIYNLIEEYKEAREGLVRLKDELDTQSWGLKKTNEGIKILYKELEKKTEEVKRLDKLKSDFLYSVSHELRTPLTTIRETVSQVLDGILGETTQEQREFLSICLEDIDRLTRIINNLLDIAKIEAGKVRIKRKIVNIAELAKGICSAFSPRANSKGLEIKTVITQEKIELYADKDKIIQVFNNLVGNALKFTEKGHIEIFVADKDDCVECSVSDTGRGIAEEQLSSVFSKFQQFGRTPGPGEKGTGLGLSISKGIVELHHGNIWVESKLNQGTKFIFTLPKHSARQLIKQYFAADLRGAFEEGLDLSVLIFYIKNFDAINKKMGKEKTDLILQDLEELVENSLGSKEDVFIKDNQAILIMLPETSREDALIVEGRLRKVFDEYLSKGRFDDELEIAYKVINYPEDVKSEEQLIEGVIGMQDI